MQKFKLLVKRLSYVKVECCHLNHDAKRLIILCFCYEMFVLFVFIGIVKRAFFYTVMKVFQKNPVVIFVFCVVHAVA